MPAAAEGASLPPKPDSRNPSATHWSEDEEDAGDEVERLQMEVAEMAEMIRRHRETVPRRVEELEELFRAQRPAFLDLPSEEAGRRSDDGNLAESSMGFSHSERDKEMLAKLHLFQTKTTKIIEMLPKVLKRMNDCIERVGRVCQHNVQIPSVFKRQRML